MQLMYDHQLYIYKKTFFYLIYIINLLLKIKKIEPYGFSNRTLNLTMSDKTSINKFKQKNALMPNLVHSLDSTALFMLYNIFKYSNKYINFYSVHDCFGAHPNEFENLTDLVLIEFVKLYTDFGFLTKFHERILQSFRDHHIIINQDENGENYILLKKVKFKIPNLPKKGNLDLNKTLESKHFLT